MTRNEILRRIKELEHAIRAEGVQHLAIYGSRARGDEGTDSDLDVIIDLVPNDGFSLLNLSGVALIIEDATGVPTQIVLRRSAPAKFRERIRSEELPVF